ncbi:hypothetical protein CY35_17G100000 [Sphagnum magellanicum]|nr:hypothetical protein CY35_17G100000 [Sphagnum magellanicum]
MEEEQIWQVHCPIVGCGTKLRGLGDLEAHYVSRHTATCSVCAQMFPTTRLLNLHVSETHDSFFQAKVARNYPMYECLVEGCAGRFHTDMARLQHLVDKHRFPRSFHFHIKKHASQRHRQRYRTHRTPLPDNGRHQSKQPSMMSEKSADKKPTTGPTPSLSKGISEVQEAGTAEDGRGIMDCGSDLEMRMDVDELTTAVSRLSTTAKEADNTPSLVSFGHRRGHRMPFLSGQQNNPSGRSRGSSHGKQRQTSTLHQT